MVKSVYMAPMTSVSIKFGIFFYVILIKGMPAKAAIAVEAQNNE